MYCLRYTCNTCMPATYVCRRQKSDYNNEFSGWVCYFNSASMRPLSWCIPSSATLHTERRAATSGCPAALLLQLCSIRNNITPGRLCRTGFNWRLSCARLHLQWRWAGSTAHPRRSATHRLSDGQAVILVGRRLCCPCTAQSIIGTHLPFPNPPVQRFSTSHSVPLCVSCVAQSHSLRQPLTL